MDSFRNIRDGGIQKVETAADRLALIPADGDIVEQLDTHSLYSYDESTASWILISQPAVSDLVTSVFGRTGDIIAQTGDYNKTQVGLGNVDNTSDLDKPISNATQAALDDKEDVINKVTNLNSPDNITYPTTLAVSNSIGVLSDAFIDMQEPNGFINRTDSSLSFDHTSRTLTVSPVSGSYSIYVASNKLTISTNKTVTIPNITGTYYFYIDGSANLAYTTTFDPSLIASLAYCAIIYWDATGTGAARIVTFGDERHGITMDGKSHAYLHTTRGAAFGNGCGLTNFTINAGNNNADAQFTASSGLIWDEDIQFNISAQTQFAVLYRSGTSWKKKTADAFPLIYNGVAGYTGTRIAYNLNTAGNWSLVEVQNNKFVLMHVFATNDINSPFICILGQAEYNDKSSARAAAATELQQITGLPVTEFVAIGSIVYETSNAYSNTPKARVVNINSENYVDYRLQIVRLGALS
jgi:phage baseplate assembly protein gpV